MFWFLSLILFALLVVYFVVRPYLRELWKPKAIDDFTKRFPSDFKNKFILGHSDNFNDCTNTIEQWNTLEAYGREALQKAGFTSFWIFNRPFIVVADPVVAELISKNCLNKEATLKHYLISLMRNNTALAATQDWQAQRKILVPMFRQRNLVYNMTVFNKLGQMMVQKMSKHCEEIISIEEYITSHNMNLLCELICGQPLTDQELGLQIVKAFTRCSELVSNRMCTPLFHLTPVYKWTSMCAEFEKNMNTVKGFVGKLIDVKEREMAERQNNKRDPEDDKMQSILEHLLELNVYDRQDLIFEIIMFFMGVVDTSTLTPCFVIALLAKHPDVQEKVYNELKEVLGDTNVHLDVDGLARLKYLDAVIKESLRLYPPGSVLVRDVDKDILLPSGVTIPKGIGALIITYILHRNPACWGEDAELFKPERFLSGEIRHPGSYLAFSLGPRNCPGYRFGMLMVKTILVYILRSYEVLPVSAEDMKKPFHLKFDILLRDVDKFRVRLKPRVSQAAFLIMETL